MSEPAEITIPDRTMTFEEFLAWAETVPKEAGRFELWDGRVIAKKGPAGSMNAERSQHWEMKLALTLAFHEAIKAAAIVAHVATEGPTVKLPPTGRGVEPDVLVYLGPKVPRNVLVVPEPVIVCEVLSPSTAKHDMSAKLEGYFALPSIQHYIIADPDRPMLIVHSRGADTTNSRISDGTSSRVSDGTSSRVSDGTSSRVSDGTSSRVSDTTFSTRLVSDPAATLRLDPPGLEVSMAEVLAG